MTRIVRSAVLFAFLGVVAPAQTADGSATPQPIVGAYSPANLNSPEVQQAKQFVQARMASLALTDVRIAYTQVVAGLNIKLITNALEDGRQVSWKFVVYRDLNNQYSLSVAERL